ncbi:MAG TPA: putative quinol monooxygenase [Mycobacteriales bacterium]|nr:putative quinol monooxygenase [Mycobacteriales bacterium]
MIIITGQARIKTDHRDAALAAAAEMSANSLAEPGCLDYRFWVSASDPDSMLLLEQWQDQAALDAHLAAPHLARFVESIWPTLDGGMDVVRHEVADSRPLS